MPNEITVSREWLERLVELSDVIADLKNEEEKLNLMNHLRGYIESVKYLLGGDKGE